VSHGLLEVLRYFLLGLLWLFFLYAGRLVIVEVRRGRKESEAGAEPAPHELRAHERPVTIRLRVIEPPASRGRVYELEHEATFGRSPACTVPLGGDTYASSVHARIFRESGEVFVEDLNSKNGTLLNEERLEGPRRLRRGDRLKIGATTFEVAR